MTTIDSVTGASTTGFPTAPTAADDGLGKDAFLKLLVAQLKYQDPLNPAEGSEFMAQTAQFTMVDKLTELAAQSSELLASQRTLAGASFIGRVVTYPGPDGVDVTGTVTGVKLGADGPVLRVDGVEVPMASVKQVDAPSDPA